MRGVLAYLAACLVVYGFVYYGQFRYRLPMEPLMILVATPLVVSLWQARGALWRHGEPGPGARPRPRPDRGGAFALRLAWILVYGRISLNSTARSTTPASTSSPPRASPTGPATPGSPASRRPAGRRSSPSVSPRSIAFGIRLNLALGLNVVLATATVIPIYLVAERMLGWREARVAAVLFGDPARPALHDRLVPVGDHVHLRAGRLRAGGLPARPPGRQSRSAWHSARAALTRGEGFLMLAIPLAAWWGHVDRRTWLRRSPWWSSMAPTIMPWTIRNAVVMDAFIPVSASTNWTLASAHSLYANGTEVHTPASWTPDLRRGESANARELRRRSIEWAGLAPAWRAWADTAPGSSSSTRWLDRWVAQRWASLLRAAARH